MFLKSALACLDAQVEAHRVAAVAVELRDLRCRDAAPQRKTKHLRLVVFRCPITPSLQPLLELVEARFDRVVARAVGGEKTEPCPPGLDHRREQVEVRAVHRAVAKDLEAPPETNKKKAHKTNKPSTHSGFQTEEPCGDTR